MSGKVQTDTEKTIYVQSVRKNGAPYFDPTIQHSDIMNGAVFEFDMGPSPKRWWVRP